MKRILLVGLSVVMMSLAVPGQTFAGEGKDSENPRTSQDVLAALIILYNQQRNSQQPAPNPPPPPDRPNPPPPAPAEGPAPVPGQGAQ
jgi:hypothetical protein